MTVTLILLVFIVSLIFYLLTRQRNEHIKFIDKIPGPKGIPFLGNALQFNISPDKIWKKLHLFYDLYYPIWKGWMGPYPVVMIRHPDDIQTLLSCKSNINKAKFIYEAVANQGIDGILISGGDKWKSRRKLLNLAFNTSLIRGYVDITNDYMKRFVEKFAPEEEETIVELRSLFLLHSLKILSEAAFGVKLEDIFSEDEVQEMLHAFDEFSESLYSRATKPYIMDWMAKFMSVGARMNKALSVFYNFRDKILAEKRKQNRYLEYESILELDDQIESEVDASSSRGRLKGQAVLDLLLAAHHTGLIDDHALSEEFFIILSAGFETSGSQMGFALLLLAENKKAQDLARAEVERVFNDADGNVGYAEIIKMEYLERCMKEALRVLPTAALIGRTTSEDIHFRNYKVPPGTEVIMSIYALHRDPNFWPEPTKFDPDRFLPENSKDRHPFAYCPFSGGPRNCIGQKFALFEVQTVVAHVLYNFEIEPISLSADIEFGINFTLTPRVPLQVKLKRIVRK